MRKSVSLFPYLFEGSKISQFVYQYRSNIHQNWIIVWPLYLNFQILLGLGYITPCYTVPFKPQTRNKLFCILTIREYIISSASWRILVFVTFLILKLLFYDVFIALQMLIDSLLAIKEGCRFLLPLIGCLQAVMKSDSLSSVFTLKMDTMVSTLWVHL